MSDGRTEIERPLSPHLQVYRPMLTMMMSMAHRVSGVALAVGFALFAWWLIAVSAGPEAYAKVAAFWSSLPGQVLLFLFTWALIHHLLGGIRHLIWDTLHALDKPTIERLAWATIIGSTNLNLLLWIVGVWMRGSL
ncbi:succinate dehydrogenase, cytochrome b556 subunit [Methyloligella sp. 2.7D]|uniref:succinate dehydrogenase, cytochrome b556 subunit n=1 Tax=unclassified Methyloligella TaxID=2625955 RepID=UPI00157D68E7|nr:succinate dehydrogenase, cytochrome b556 subunit [Methyloligella sp. GL2]QKP76389.1 succinate dehydrogenase, cytochrome b556 subunit [Methyloligella sp. GL2]